MGGYYGMSRGKFFSHGKFKLDSDLTLLYQPVTVKLFFTDIKVLLDFLSVSATNSCTFLVAVVEKICICEMTQMKIFFKLFWCFFAQK